MSFKREGDDWSQLNVLKVSGEERRESGAVSVPGEGAVFVALATAAVAGGGGRERLELGSDPLLRPVISVLMVLIRIQTWSLLFPFRPALLSRRSCPL